MKKLALLMVVGMVAFACAKNQPAEETKTDAAPAQAKVAEAPKDVTPPTPPKAPAPAAMEKYSASHILVMHTDITRPKPGVTRTKEDAKKMIDELSGKLKGGAEFAALAKEHSDCPSGEHAGGNLGVFPGQRMVPEFVVALKTLEEGAVSEPVETPFGYHIIKRQKVEEVHARHILLMHTDSMRKPPTITRTKGEAKTLIDEIAGKIEAGGDFAQLAKEHSDCPSGKRAGGDLGSFGKGQMAPAFETTAFNLKDNEISKVIETDFGYHIVQRLPL